MSWLSLLGTALRLANAIADALRERRLITAGEERGRAASNADHAREAAARGAAMRNIAAKPPSRAEIDRRLEEGSG
jgi:hypothetical protein